MTEPQCPEIMVGGHSGQPDTLWTCAQRAGHPGPHNRVAPADGCTAWADHCSVCAEHVCICSNNAPSRSRATTADRDVTLTDAEREALANAKHQTWHVGCVRECGGRLDDHIASDRVLAPAVERIVTDRIAQALAPIRDFHARWGDTDGDSLDPLALWEDLGRLLAGQPRSQDATYGMCTACGSVEVQLVNPSGTRDLSGIGESSTYPTGYGCEACA